MGLARWFDQRVGEALPPGSLVAPRERLEALGPCAECGRPPATHAYELMAQTADGAEPHRLEVEYESAIVCEPCYHRLAERGFWIKSAEEACLLIAVFAAIAAAGFALTRAWPFAAAGAGSLLVLPLIRRWLRSIRERMLERAVARWLPRTQTASFAAMRMPWLEKSILSVVPVPLAIIVHPDLHLKEITAESLQRILRGELTNWQQVGGPNLAIHLALPVGPWREWSFIHEHLLGGEEPAAHTELAHPLEVFDYLADDKSVIGFISLVLLEHWGCSARPLAVDGQECNVDNADYPLWLMDGLVPVE